MTIAVNRNLSNCENSPKKRFFGATTGFEPVASALALQCSPSCFFFFFGLFSQLLKLRFTAMVTYSFHLYSRSSHHFIQTKTSFQLSRHWTWVAILLNADWFFVLHLIWGGGGGSDNPTFHIHFCLLLLKNISADQGRHRKVMTRERWSDLANKL